MRIVHTESSLGWGGQENRILNEMIGMRELGHDAAVVCQPGARLGERAREGKFETFEVGMRNALDLPAMLALRRIFRRFRADIVNTHSGRDTQVAGLAARSMVGAHRPQVVRTRHLALPITSRYTYSVLPDHVVAVSRFVADGLIAAGVARSRVTAVHTGIDLAHYTPAEDGGRLREELNLPPECVLIGTVAILRIKKGHAELLEAARIVLRTYPDTHFVIAGNGPQEANLRRRIAEFGLESRVHMLGLRRDVTNILQSLDLFVLPTFQEALGTAFMEAGAMGLPVVATAVDGVPEVVVDGETGLLIPPRNSPALAQAIMTLLADPERRRTLGENGRRRVGNEFSRRAMTVGMLRVYQRLLEAR